MLPLSMWANAEGLPSRRYTDMGSPRADLEAQVQILVMLPLMLSKAILILPVLAFFRKTSLIWSVKCRWKINQGKRPSTWTAGYHFLPKLSYGMCSVRQSVTDDKGLCHGIHELIPKKIVRCFHALQSQLEGGEPHQYVAWLSLSALIDHLLVLQETDCYHTWLFSEGRIHLTKL